MAQSELATRRPRLGRRLYELGVDSRSDGSTSVAAGRPSLRRRLYEALEPGVEGQRGLSLLNKIVCTVILASAASAIIETEPTVAAPYAALFGVAEIIFTSFFVVEYAARVWISVENARCGPGWRGRIRYILSPIAILDLLAFAPTLLSVGGGETFVLRLFRLVRIVRLARLGRFSSAIQYIGEAVRSRSYELALTMGIAAILLVFSSTLLYVIEGPTQPDAFGSIPRAMWWAVITLTTVGYGDVYPVSVLGRIVAGLTAVSGIGLIAMPTGILASAFSDAVQRHKMDKDKKAG